MRQPSIQKIFLKLFTGSVMFFIIISVLLLSFYKVTANEEVKIWDYRQINLTENQYIKILQMEVPLIQQGVQASINNDILYNFFSFFTLQSANDLIKNEIPMYSLVLLNGESHLDIQSDLPVELAPPEEFFEAEKNKTIANNEENTSDIPVNSENKKVVFIYHTHNRESFLPELDTDEPSEAYHPTINVTLVGQKLADELEKLGIGTSVSKRDYWTELKPGEYYLSYKLSLGTVQTAMQNNKDITYIFDIHRDGIEGGKEKTTRVINGQSYAAVYFIIGEGNKNYQLNKEFAIEIHENLEKLYPGLSKGIYEKKQTSGTNGEYNQSVSPYSLTIEIGGVKNTLEEEYRTAKALAEAIADIYWQAEKVDAPLY